MVTRRTALEKKKVLSNLSNLSQVASITTLCCKRLVKEGADDNCPLYTEFTLT